MGFWLTTHKADEMEHGIGNKATIVTTHKTYIVGAINEAFTFADNGKTAIATAVNAKGVSASKVGQIIPGAAIESVQRGLVTVSSGE